MGSDSLTALAVALALLAVVGYLIARQRRERAPITDVARTPLSTDSVTPGPSATAPASSATGPASSAAPSKGAPQFSLLNKHKEYDRVRFSSDVIQEALAVFRTQAGEELADLSIHMRAEIDDATWRFNSEVEFFAEYRRARYATFTEHRLRPAARVFEITAHSRSTEISVSGVTRGEIEAVFNVFERNLDSSRLPSPPLKPASAVTVFVGHGRDPQWRDLKDHLHEKHGYLVEAYEVGARAGHAIRDVLEEMLTSSSFAILVMTGEDAIASGELLRARQNVVHEVGLFQGRLGFRRAIVLLEDGTEEFSNIQGLAQIRFSRGRIQETFGDVLATLRREFGPKERP